MQFNKTAIAAALGALLLQGCATTDSNYSSSSSTSGSDSDRVSALERELEASKMELENERLLRSEIESEAAKLNLATADGPLLPPNAKAGECYARVWVDPTYRTLTKTITTQEASEKVEIIPAKYEWAEEQVLVKEASSELVSVPATYKTVSEQIMVSAAERQWVSDLNSKNPVSQELLTAAKNGGIDIAGSPVNMCYHEHVLPAETRQVSESIQVTPASFTIETNPATYRTVEKQVLVKPASTKLVKVPAQYETYSEQVIDKPAHTTWKKGSGPIQKIDEATGEIMCLVEVPATYKTINRTRLVSAETVQEVEIPAEYETITVRELVSEASENRIEIPATYKTVTRTEVVSEPTFVWHEVHDKSLGADSRTGNKVCLTETAAKYQTVQKQVIEQEAYSREVEIPAVYETRKYRKLVADASEIRTEIPEKTQTISYRELENEGFMEWRSILCDTNVTNDLISSLQRKLNSEGYDAGNPDGVVGQQTMTAVNDYQRDNNLPLDQYLNIETLKHLDIL